MLLKNSLTMVCVLWTGAEARLNIYSAEPLNDEENDAKEQYIEQGFADWSRRDFQQFVKALEAHGWYVVL